MLRVGPTSENQSHVICICIQSHIDEEITYLFRIFLPCKFPDLWWFQACIPVYMSVVGALHLAEFRILILDQHFTNQLSCFLQERMCREIMWLCILRWFTSDAWPRPHIAEAHRDQQVHYLDTLHTIYKKPYKMLVRALIHSHLIYI